MWETLDNNNIYLGHSINLYNRISSYFMPSILNTKSRRVIRYLNKHGFSNIKLTLYIMDIESSLDQVVTLEQDLIDTLKPNLNVDLIASSSGYHGPMSPRGPWWENFVNRGLLLYIFMIWIPLLYLTIFDSKQYM